MPNLLVRNVPTKTMTALKARAKKHNRSVQAEISEILNNTIEADAAEANFWRAADKIRKKLKGTVQTDSTELIREARDSR